MNFQTFVNRKIKGTLSRWFGIQFQYPSETAKVRNWVLPYCVGKGCDIGFGGDKVKKYAATIKTHSQYSNQIIIQQQLRN
ncbi:MAG: hypothetical protein EO766_00795 [Hydrotalea sp. AMD]|uniref:hypothetical protein n=1 Tax=Hydrotalea sp. AMD TaxID=2501297 RepID=UPI000944F32D|nr:hypothetical protein [Hydrotalea sp. AMD]RWZ90731.1 MAG: hypothetical protein EO766_00795 [Hydrotalea sp. AMD]